MHRVLVWIHPCLYGVMVQHFPCHDLICTDDESDGRFLVDFNRKKMEQIVNERRKNELTHTEELEPDPPEDYVRETESADPSEQWLIYVTNMSKSFPLQKAPGQKCIHPKLCMLCQWMVAISTFLY